MAQFYGEIQGNRKSLTRLGSKKSGLWGRLQGQHVGVLVNCFIDEEGRDVVNIERTGGSHLLGPIRLIATLYDDPALDKFYPEV